MQRNLLLLQIVHVVSYLLQWLSFRMTQCIICILIFPAADIRKYQPRSAASYAQLGLQAPAWAPDSSTSGYEL
jgi:hypothetical protein